MSAMSQDEYYVKALQNLEEIAASMAALKASADCNGAISETQKSIALLTQTVALFGERQANDHNVIKELNEVIQGNGKIGLRETVVILNSKMATVQWIGIVIAGSILTMLVTQLLQMVLK